jgi:hypothetical protein
MTTAAAIDELYERVMAMVPEATDVSVNVSRQTSTDRQNAFTFFTVQVKDNTRHMAHASCCYTEPEVIEETMRQVANYRAAKAGLPEVCPSCGSHKEPLTDLHAEDVA